MLRRIVVITVMLASAQFFHLVVFPRQALLGFSFLITLMMAVAIVLGIIYNKKKGFPQNFSFEVMLFLMSSIFAMLGAYWGHGQSMLLTAWIQHNMYFYLFYFFLHLVRLKPKDFERLLFIMAGSFAFLYFVQYVVFPTQVVDVRADASRGTIRIFMPGLLYAEMIFYYFLHQLFKTNKLKYAGIAAIYLLIVVTMGTRQVYAITGFGVLVLIFVSKQVKSRAFMMMMIMAGCALIFVIFEDIFMQLMEVSQEQTAQDDDDIRVRSATFWLTDFQPLFITYITGNGVGHQASSFGMQILYYKTVFGFYQSDVGIIGSYSMYGVLSVIGFVMIIRKIFVIKVQPEYKFIKFWTVTLIFHSVLGWPFFHPDGITIIVSALYLLDISNYQLKQEAYDLSQKAIKLKELA